MGYMTMTDERTPYRRMTVSEDALWGLRQAGRRLERYVEEFLEQIDLVLFPPAPARKAKPWPPEAKNLHILPQRL